MLRPAQRHAQHRSAGGSSAGWDRTCRGRSSVRQKNAPVASDELATSRLCQCRRCPPLRLSGAASAGQPAFDAARPESRHRGGQRSVCSMLVACHGGRRRGHAGRAARRRASSRAQAHLALRRVLNCLVCQLNRSRGGGINCQLITRANNQAFFRPRKTVLPSISLY